MRLMRSWLFGFVWLFSTGFLVASDEIPITEPPADIAANLKLSSFYKKFASADGVPIVASGKVSDDAMREAVWIVNKMLADREDVRKAIINNRVRVAIMAPGELTTDIPEHSDLRPKDYWDKRARGLGATFARPAISCGEENLLNLRGDRYASESILVHEFAHTIHEMGLITVDKAFDAKLRSVHRAALDRELWKKTYAATNHKEYWAEGVQSYFDCNASNNPQHNDIDTREELAKYDPMLFELIDETFRKSKWRYERHDKRQPKR